MLSECTVLATLVMLVKAKMEGYIVGGNYSDIINFPHAAFLTLKCVTAEKTTEYWICGSSVVNQKLLLTAAHCLDRCQLGTVIVINFGDVNRNSGLVRSSNRFVMHEKYRVESIVYDIALIKVHTEIPLSLNVRRVALMKQAPILEPAFMAGWGLTDELKKIGTKRLKHVYQKVLPIQYCKELFEDFPIGVFCASSQSPDDYPSRGDSGSALVVQDYIQIGVVSYKEPDVTRHVLVYTDVGYFYDWIELQAKILFCHPSSVKSNLSSSLEN